jgi:alanine dehydrogenase
MLTDNEVKDLLSIPEVVEAVELAFKQKGLGRVQMPAKTYLYYRKHGGDLRTMPAFLEDLDISAVKIVNVHPENPCKNDLPTVMALIILINPSNGAPLAIMGGTTITHMRTGAAGYIAAKYLARKDSKVVGIIGAGTQAKAQLTFLLKLFTELQEVRVFDCSKAALNNFMSEMQETYRKAVRFVSAANVREAVEEADMVVTATPSRKPLVTNDMISPGMHINCIGADATGKQELDPKILNRSKIIIDDWEQAAHSGEINVPLSRGLITKEHIWAEIGDIVAGLKTGRQSSDEITVFVSTGLAVQDAVTAKLAYSKALVKKAGQLMNLM